jgi:glucoamylase
MLMPPDGPALRAIALIKYANYLLSMGDRSYVANFIWPIIQRDLDYVVSNGNSGTYVHAPFSAFHGTLIAYRFDLWEEVYSLSFFTTAVQRRSLRDGADLADRLGKNSAPYRDQAKNLLDLLQVSLYVLSFYFIPLHME